MCMSVFLRMCLCLACVQCPLRPDEGVGSPETRVTDGCRPPWVCWELNSRSSERAIKIISPATPKSSQTHCQGKTERQNFRDKY